jgi:hypothetical protein
VQEQTRERVRRHRAKKKSASEEGPPTDSNADSNAKVTPSYSESVSVPVSEVKIKREENSAEITEKRAIEPSSVPSLVGLPREATAFLAMFYEPAMNDAQRARYRNVLAQIYETLSPRHPGPKIRGGQRVKARSVEHLVDTINAVMRDPPPNRDLAIVWLLNKLLDPPKGPSATERQKREQEADRNQEELYQREAKRVGVGWAKEHPDEYGRIVAAVNAEFRGASGIALRVGRDASLTQRCARAAGFPSYEQWQDAQRILPGARP